MLAVAASPAAAQVGPVASPSGPVTAGPYVVIDAATGEALLQRDAGAFWYPASLTKIMTIYVVFEELKAGRLQLAEQLPFSEFARAKPPSKLGLAPGGTVTVEQGLQALVARSANDVATAFAERISGSEAQFALRMTETASRLGMLATQYRNAHGLPDAGQLTTARDQALLGMAMVRDFPQYYPYFRTQEFMLGKQKIGPGIKFLDLYGPYADGLKTGFICSSGFNIAGSAVLCDFVRSFASGFIFSTALPPAIAAGARASIRHLKTDNALRDRLHERAATLRRRLDAIGVPHLANPSHIVPVMIGDPVLCKTISDLLLDEHGIYVQPINYPTVPKGAERLRITPSPVHSDVDMDRLVAALEAVWERFGVRRAA